jgi:hypothetical protein
MREFLKSSARGLRAGWFWPLVLLALPNCSQLLGVEDWEAGKAFNPGPAPLTSAIMCDIPHLPDTVPDCAMDAVSGMPKEYAAVALAQGEQNSLVYDFSAIASSCGGLPQKMLMFNDFPDGRIVCLNAATQIPAVYPDGNAVCIAQCIDLINSNDLDGRAEGFCKANAHVSTNFDKFSPVVNACSPGGTPTMDPKDDTRRIQDPIKWVTQNGTNNGVFANNLTRTAGRSGLFDAGAYSDPGKKITHGDGWVEFEVSDNTKQYAIGVSPCGAFVAEPCDTDSDETLADIAFAIVLNGGGLNVVDGQVHVFENGIEVGGPFGPFAAGDRFRVRVNDNNDGKASILYTKLNGPCTTGTICNEFTFASGSGPSPTYPLRVDVSLVDPQALLQNVTLVRIQDLP